MYTCARMPLPAAAIYLTVRCCQLDAAFLHLSTARVASQQPAAECPKAEGWQALCRGQAAEDGGGGGAAELLCRRCFGALVQHSCRE